MAAKRRVPAPYTGPPDIYETGDSIFVLAEMPGVAPNDVDNTLARNVLTIRGHALTLIGCALHPTQTPPAGPIYHL